MNCLKETQPLTVAEVARRLQQSERTGTRQDASGALPAVKIGTCREPNARRPYRARGAARGEPSRQRRVPSLGESTSAAGTRDR